MGTQHAGRSSQASFYSRDKLFNNLVNLKILRLPSRRDKVFFILFLSKAMKVLANVMFRPSQAAVSGPSVAPFAIGGSYTTAFTKNLNRLMRDS